MGFGSLLRSFSDPKRRPEAGRRRQQSQQLQRRQSVHVRRGPASSQDAMAAYQRAKDIYEAEAAQLSRDEVHKRNRNDLECKRHMAMIERRMRDERQQIDTAVHHETVVLVSKYRAGKIESRELEKSKQKLKKKADEKWASLTKWQAEEQSKAQRIFFSRGEEIAESTGASLRKAREKMERNQRIPRA